MCNFKPHVPVHKIVGKTIREWWKGILEHIRDIIHKRDILIAHYVIQTHVVNPDCLKLMTLETDSSIIERWRWE